MRAERLAAVGAVLLTLLLPQCAAIDVWPPANAVRYIVVHHAASGWDPDPAHPQASTDISAHEIDAMHRARGFDEIGYHYVVRLDGAVEKGRPEDQRGAHAKAWDSAGISYNASSIGVCFAGNCDAAPWTAAQSASGLRLIRELMRRYRVPPERVIGHCECGMDTHCPGTLVDMDALRRELAKP